MQCSRDVGISQLSPEIRTRFAALCVFEARATCNQNVLSVNAPGTFYRKSCAGHKGKTVRLCQGKEGEKAEHQRVCQAVFPIEAATGAPSRWAG